MIAITAIHSIYLWKASVNSELEESTIRKHNQEFCSHFNCRICYKKHVMSHKKSEKMLFRSFILIQCLLFATLFFFLFMIMYYRENANTIFTQSSTDIPKSQLYSNMPINSVLFYMSQEVKSAEKCCVKRI